MNWLSLCADILTVISAIVTVVSVFTIKSYYNKIVRQYSVEKLTLAEQYIHNSIEIMQKIKRIYSSDTRGLSVKKIGGLYLDIEENINHIVFDLPLSFDGIMKCSTEAKKKIKLSTKTDTILSKNCHFEELDDLLNAISLNIKKEKENIQKANMK